MARDYEISLHTSSSSKTVGSAAGAYEGLPSLRVTPDTMDDFHAFSPGRWNGQHVWVHNCTPSLDDPMWLAGPLCAPYEHDLYRMTHHNPDGPDWGTGFLSCRKCFGTALEPGGAGAMGAMSWCGVRRRPLKTTVTHLGTRLNDEPEVLGVGQRVVTDYYSLSRPDLLCTIEELRLDERFDELVAVAVTDDGTRIGPCTARWFFPVEDVA